MKNNIYLLFISIFLLFYASSCSADTPKDIPNADLSASAAPKSDDMSLEEKIGQMFFVRCDNENIDNILSKSPAGLVMFANDFKDLTKDEVIEKISSYQKKSKIPLIIGVDEEGGTVVRVSSNPNLSDEKYKSPQEYYNEGGIEKIRENTVIKSKLLTSLGINMNLAPVCDVSTCEEDFIYDRSLGKDALTTSEYVSEVVKTMNEIGIASCLKHFPGYGNNVDTHTGIAIDNRQYEEFTKNDFLPFSAGIEAGADAVLVSHNIVNCMDSQVPASISPAVHEILRNSLGFNGIIMTDDMSMDAMKDYGTPYVKAVNAGNDLIIVTDFDLAYDEVLTAVKSGKIDENTINTAVERIIEWKNNNL